MVMLVLSLYLSLVTWASIDNSVCVVNGFSTTTTTTTTTTNVISRHFSLTSVDHRRFPSVKKKKKCQWRCCSSVNPSRVGHWAAPYDDFEESNDSNEYNVDDDDDEGGAWNPSLRKSLVVIASLGFAETSYLTYEKVWKSSSASSSWVEAVCSASSAASSSSCGDVLSGPYASLHFGDHFDIPLSALGMLAYAAVAFLASYPLLFAASSAHAAQEDVPQAGNRIALLGTTTLMASFSVYLMSLLIGVLHAQCLFCFASATLSILLAGLCWTGGVLPSSPPSSSSSAPAHVIHTVTQWRKRGLVTAASSVGFATITALALFLSVSGIDDDNTATFIANNNDAPTTGSTTPTTTLLASANSNAQQYRQNIPPRITTKSSPDALILASDLSSLHSRMFGAFWCSHCYDQKQTMGMEAMSQLPYIECDKEGYNNQRQLCKERGIPGYPTWEINGELYPGERSLDELKEIVDQVKKQQ